MHMWLRLGDAVYAKHDKKPGAVAVGGDALVQDDLVQDDIQTWHADVAVACSNTRNIFRAYWPTLAAGIFSRI